jgi:predicted metal-binding membrane protein
MTANSFDMSQGGDAGKVLFGLVCVVAIAWIYLLAGAGVDSYAALVFAMWAIMMVPMMLPSAAAPRS